MSVSLKGRKFGVALGSGSARGLAHIGVLEAIDELGLRVDYLSGSSMGALVGAFYAAGKLQALKSAALELDWRRMWLFVDIMLPDAGLIDGTKISAFIKEHTGDPLIENLNIPYASVSTSLKSGSEVVYRSGPVVDAVRASISVPGIFTPVWGASGELLVDGGLVNPVPVNVLKSMGADFTLAVELNHDIYEKRNQAEKPSDTETDNSKGRREPPWYEDLLSRTSRSLSPEIRQALKGWFEHEESPGLVEVLLNSIYIMQKGISEARLKLDRPDILVQPHLGEIRFIEFNRAKQCIEAGRTEALRVLKKALACQDSVL